MKLGYKKVYLSAYEILYKLYYILNKIIIFCWSRNLHNIRLPCSLKCSRKVHLGFYRQLSQFVQILSLFKEDIITQILS